MIPKSFYDRDARIVAKQILGKILIRKSMDLYGRIIESEAYYGINDPASRIQAERKTKLSMWWRNAEPGDIFVYMVHGNWLMNIVTGRLKNEPTGVLIRSLKPLKGIKIMMKKRKTSDIKNLTSGPGKLTKAFGITKKCTGMNVSDKKSDISIVEGRNEKFEIKASGRIGVRKDFKKKMRFYIKDNVFVSR
jgi:DNA-3-methyladenine glycosylase